MSILNILSVFLYYRHLEYLFHEMYFMYAEFSGFCTLGKGSKQVVCTQACVEVVLLSLCETCSSEKCHNRVRSTRDRLY